MLKVRTLLVLLSMVLCFYSSFSQALVLDHLYKAEVFAESRSDSARILLMKEAFSQVLSQVAGKTVSDHPVVKAAFKNPSAYVQTYAYKGEKLEVTFHPAMIQTLLERAGFIHLDAKRPLMVMWLVVDSPFDRHIVGQESDPALVSMFEKIAHARGLPVIVPLLDLEDLQQVSADAIWTGSIQALARASKRYKHDGFVVGRLTSVPSSKGTAWSCEWEMHIDGKHYQWQDVELPINEALHAGMDGLVDHLLQLYAKKDQGHYAQAEMIIAVQQIQSAKDYAQVTDYLKNLSPVASIDVERLEPDQTVFKLTLRGNNTPQSVEQAIDGARMISLVPKANTDASYRWVG